MALSNIQAIKLCRCSMAKISGSPLVLKGDGKTARRASSLYPRSCNLLATRNDMCIDFFRGNNANR